MKLYYIEYVDRDIDNYSRSTICDDFFTLDEEYAIEVCDARNGPTITARRKAKRAEYDRITRKNKQGKLEHDALVAAGLRKGEYKPQAVPSPDYEPSSYDGYWRVESTELDERA